MTHTIDFLRLLVCGAALLPALTTAQTAAPARAAACVACHGPNGNSTQTQYPILAGQTSRYLYLQLRDYQEGRRSDPQMSPMVKDVPRDELRELADYFAAQKVVSPRAGEPLQAAKGKEIFENGLPTQAIPPCKSCHGEQGQGMDGVAPRVAQQHADYIVKQLQVFKRTDQRPEGAVMKVIAHGLETENMENAAQYLQGMTASSPAR